MGLKGYLQTLGQADFVSSATQIHELGAVAMDSQGRRYRYVLAGAANLVAGNVLQSPIWPSDQVNLAVAANAAIGATTVTVTNGGANAVTAGQYTNGILVIETTPGEGYGYRIVANSAAATGATITVTIETPGLMVALTAAGSKVSLHLNPYSGVIQCPVTTLTGRVIGIATYIITAAQYGWVGIRGTFGVLIAGTPALGNAVSVPGAVAGAITVNTNTGLLRVVGYMAVTGVDTKVKAVDVTIN